MTQYFQCNLSQGTTRAQAYIEERGAKVGRRVEVKDAGFNGLWTVDQVGDKGIDEAVLRDKQKRDKHFNQDI